MAQGWSSVRAERGLPRVVGCLIPGRELPFPPGESAFFCNEMKRKWRGNVDLNSESDLTDEKSTSTLPPCSDSALTTTPTAQTAQTRPLFLVSLFSSYPYVFQIPPFFIALDASKPFQTAKVPPVKAVPRPLPVHDRPCQWQQQHRQLVLPKLKCAFGTIPPPFDDSSFKTLPHA